MWVGTSQSRLPVKRDWRRSSWNQFAGGNWQLLMHSWRIQVLIRLIFYIWWHDDMKHCEWTNIWPQGHICASSTRTLWRVRWESYRFQSYECLIILQEIIKLGKEMLYWKRNSSSHILNNVNTPKPWPFTKVEKDPGFMKIPEKILISKSIVGHWSINCEFLTSWSPQ